MAATTRLTAVGEEFVPEAPALRIDAPAASSAGERAERALLSLLMVTLKTLPAKTLIALMGLADLAMIGSVFVLCLLVIRQPAPLQLGGLAGYAVFVLAALKLRRR